MGARQVHPKRSGLQDAGSTRERDLPSPPSPAALTLPLPAAAQHQLRTPRRMLGEEDSRKKDSSGELGQTTKHDPLHPHSSPAQDVPPGSVGLRASPQCPPHQVFLPGTSQVGASGSARGCTPGLAVPGEEGRGPFRGWPHGTVTAAAFQEGSGSAPAVQGTALPCRHLPEKNHSWKGAQGQHCPPRGQHSGHREGVPTAGGTP